MIPRRDGRKRYNHLNPVPIQRLHDRWVSRYTRPWAEALVGLKDELEGTSRERGARVAGGDATPHPGASP